MHSRDWASGNFVDHSKFKAQPGYVRGLFTDISDRLAAIFYGFTSGETTDGVKKLPFTTQASAPDALADNIYLYGKDVAGKVELHAKDEDGNEIRMTKAGALNVDISNNALLTGDQTIAGVKTFSSSPIVPAPTTDLQAATKKYVDDTAPSLGAWASKSANTSYQAETDLFLVVSNELTSSSGGTAAVTIYSDASNPPTTARASMLNVVNSGTVSTISESATIPVKAGDYYKVVNSGDVASQIINIIPLS